MQRVLRLSLLASLFSTTACLNQDQRPATLDGALPTGEQLRMKVPEGETRAIGQLAEYYTQTRNLTRTLNGSIETVLDLLHSIIEYPVTTVEGNVYTWGPWRQILAPAEYKLVVTQRSDGSFDYQLAGRPIDAAAAASTAPFETVISGHAIPGVAAEQGKGNVLLDFDVSEHLDPNGNNGNGQLTITYDLAARTLELDAVSVEHGRAVTAHYSYQDQADGSGNMVFGMHGNVDAGPGLETLTLRSRWLSTRAGRGDARITGGDVGSAELTASECWDSSFRRVFFTAAAGSLGGTEGNVASCAFATADLPPRP